MTCGILFAAGMAALIYAVAALYKRTGADDAVDVINEEMRGDL